MINRTMKKLEEYSKAIADIMKSFLAIIASFFAILTASITGYMEVRKLTTQALVVRAESKSVRKSLNSIESSGKSSETVATTTYTSSSSVPSGYKVDMNTGILAFAILIIPLIWYFEKKINKNKKNNHNI